MPELFVVTKETYQDLIVRDLIMPAREVAVVAGASYRSLCLRDNLKSYGRTSLL